MKERFEGIKRMERKMEVEMYPDLSGARLFLKLIDQYQYLCFIFKIPELVCDTIDRHRKAPNNDKDASSCDIFKKCYLTIAEYRSLHDPYKLQNMGIKGAFDKLESLLNQSDCQQTESIEHMHRN